MSTEPFSNKSGIYTYAIKEDLTLILTLDNKSSGIDLVSKKEGRIGIFLNESIVNNLKSQKNSEKLIATLEKDVNQEGETIRQLLKSLKAEFSTVKDLRYDFKPLKSLNKPPAEDKKLSHSPAIQETRDTSSPRNILQQLTSPAPPTESSSPKPPPKPLFKGFQQEINKIVHFIWIGGDISPTYLNSILTLSLKTGFPVYVWTDKTSHILNTIQQCSGELASIKTGLKICLVDEIFKQMQSEAATRSDYFLSPQDVKKYINFYHRDDYRI